MTAGDLAVNLVAAAIAAIATVVVGRLRQRLRKARRARFLGVAGDARSILVVVPSDPAIRPQVAVHRLDVATVIELAGLVRDAGGREKVLYESDQGVIGEQPEICVAGPEANNRTAGHLRNFLPGLTFDPYSMGPAVTLRVGGREFPLSKGQEEYVVLARLQRPGAPPILLISGQTAITNLAAARHLASEMHDLLKQYGPDGQFCLVLRVKDSPTYDTGLVESVGDFFDEASRPRSDRST